MGRFSNLELGEAQPDQPERAAEGPNYLEQAHERLRQGDFEQSLRFYSRALELDRDQPEAWLGQLLALIELDEPREARIWADKAIELFDDDAELLAGKALTLARLGAKTEALALCDAALASPGTSSLRWRVRGEAMIARDPDSAGFCFDKALAEVGADGFTALTVGRGCLFHRHWVLALRYLVRATDLDPESAWGWANRGVAHEMLAQDLQARRAYETALQVDRHQLLATNRLTALRSLGLGQRVVRWWRRVRAGSAPLH